MLKWHCSMYLAGIGRSTIAKIAYNCSAHTFDGCSFLLEILREKWNKWTVLRASWSNWFQMWLENQETNLHNVDKGMHDVKAILCCRRVLVALDDVDANFFCPVNPQLNRITNRPIQINLWSSVFNWFVPFSLKLYSLHRLKLIYLTCLLKFYDFTQIYKQGKRMNLDLIVDTK